MMARRTSDRCSRVVPIMYRLGERVLCYEPDPGRVSKIFPAIVNQVRVLPASLIYSTICVATRWVQSRGASSCIFVGGGIAGTGGFALMLYFKYITVEALPALTCEGLST